MAFLARLTYSLFVLFIFSSLVQGQLSDPVKFDHQLVKISDTEYEIQLKAKIDDGWKTYSNTIDPDAGPYPTSIEFELEEGQAPIGGVIEKGEAYTGYDKVFEADITSFKKEVEFAHRIKITDPTVPVTGYLTYMACNDVMCNPPTDVEFSYVPADVGTTASGIQDLGKGDEGDKPDVAASTGNWQPHPDYPHALWDGKKTLDQRKQSIVSTYAEPISDCGGDNTDSKDKSLLLVFLLGFAGGLVALITPCVFPMIPLTVSFFTAGSQDRKSGIRNGLIFGLSIIGIYVTIGLLVTGIFGAAALQLLSTNWIANVFFFVLFVVFAFSFFGFFEITLPSSWTTKTDTMANKGGLVGIFFMAFTLALVSFSCTGPIIGTALVQSATSAVGPFIVMLGFSSALALPFGLFAAFPALLNSLPQSGGWMNSVKVVLGFVELALALKFLSVADLTMHWNFLKYELFLGLWVIIFGLTTAYLLGWIKFPHDSPVRKFSVTRWVFVGLFAFFTVYLALGFRTNPDTGNYQTPKIMSGLLPPAHYNFFNPPPAVDEKIKKRYPSYSKCANNINCFKDYSEGLAYAKEINKPLFIDFTGHGCVNCRKVEDSHWVKDAVWKKLNNDFVLVSLYTDDRERLKKSLISKNSQKKIRVVGTLWSEFQIENFQQNSQPLYVIMNTDEEVISTPIGYNPEDSWKEYDDYLGCGLKEATASMR